MSTPYGRLFNVIYLDHNATTPIDPEVLEAMMPYLTSEWGNPSSAYRFGALARTAIDEARERVSELVSAQPDEVIFTSSATESNNTAIHSAIHSNRSRRHVITSTVEHSSVLNYLRALELEGYRVSYLPVDHDGALSVTDLENALTPDTALVSLMWANNETGVLFPIKRIVEICRSRGVLFHCDAVQAVGKIDVADVGREVDFLTLSGHKLGAPKGIGAIVDRSGGKFTPLIHGGKQQDGRRGGTENVAMIVGLGKAASLVALRRWESVNALRVQFEKQVASQIRGAQIHGQASPRLPNTTNIGLPGIEGDAAVTYLDANGICASSGSACMESSLSPSHVILAMLNDHRKASECVRFSLGPGTRAEEMNQVVEALVRFAALAR